MNCPEIAATFRGYRQPEFTPELEVFEAEKASLITDTYIARDVTKEPILGYFPGALHKISLEKTHDALLDYLDTYEENEKKKAEEHQKRLANATAKRFAKQAD